MAKQTGNVLSQMAKYCPDLKMVYALRGERGEPKHVAARDPRFNSALVECCSVENRVQRTEHIVMGTSGTVLDWILKRKVCW